MRTAIGIFAGLLTAALWLALIQGFGHWLYPLPEALDPARPEAAAEFMRTAPSGAKALVVASWFTAALTGGTVANAIARRWWTAIVVAGFVIAFASITTLLIPHPLWMKLASVAAPLIAAECANRLVRL